MLETKRIGDVDVTRVPGGWLMQTHIIHPAAVFVPDPRAYETRSSPLAKKEADDLSVLLDKGRTDAR